MESQTRDLQRRAAAAAGLAMLALVLGAPAARAEVARTGDEPWYQQPPEGARQRAQALFAQAVDKHLQLLRGDARELYEQALALWDNPDIRWNLALVLDDLGEYLRAHQQLEGALRWEVALGEERLRAVRERMAALETQRLARIDAFLDDPDAEITLDGQPWLRQSRRRSALVAPGEHYIASRKPEHFPVTRSVSVKAGQWARVALPMDEERIVETRRWSAWKPWVMVAAGVTVAAVGVELERRALGNVETAADAIVCISTACEPTRSDVYGRAETQHQLAIGAFAIGGAAIAGGLVLAWLNRSRVRRTEARPLSPIIFTPIPSPRGAELAVRVRF